jgi:hypothetical protein
VSKAAEPNTQHKLAKARPLYQPTNSSGLTPARFSADYLNLRRIHVIRV